MHVKENTLTEEFNATFLAPDTCGSSIRWSVIAKKREPYNSESGLPWFDFELSVNLTDCTRSIGWSSSDPDEAEQKLTRAIIELQNARDAVRSATRLKIRLQRRKEVRVDDEN